MGGQNTPRLCKPQISRNAHPAMYLQGMSMELSCQTLHLCKIKPKTLKTITQSKNHAMQKFKLGINAKHWKSITQHGKHAKGRRKTQKTKLRYFGISIKVRSRV